jgi:Na+/citrate or Na+/malate symporter
MCACNLAMAMTCDAMVDYLKQCFTLELARPEEFLMHFIYARYCYSMYAMNRKILVRGLIDDLCKNNVANIDDLNDQVAAKLK